MNTITVVGQRGRAIQLRVYATAGGLAVTKAADERYKVTHLASGMSLASFPRLALARGAHDAFLALGLDWTAAAGEVKEAAQAHKAAIIAIRSGDSLAAGVR